MDAAAAAATVVSLSDITMCAPSTMDAGVVDTRRAKRRGL
jgi:hypothetical protein